LALRAVDVPVLLSNALLLGFASEWAFGLNRRIGSVCSVAVNFGFHRSTTDRFAIESKTDEFGVGFVGSVFRFHRTNRGEQRNKSTERTENGRRTNRQGKVADAARSAARIGEILLGALGFELRALRFASQVPPPAAPLLTPPPIRLA